MTLCMEQGKNLDSEEVSGGTKHHHRGVYFVGDPETVAYSELGRRIARACGRKVFIVPISRLLLKTTCSLNTLLSKIRRKPSMFNCDKYREAIVPAWTSNVDKLRQEVGAEPAALLSTRD